MDEHGLRHCVLRNDRIWKAGAALLLFACCTLRAAEQKTFQNLGKYRDVTVVGVDWRGIRIKHAEGTNWIGRDELSEPEALQLREELGKVEELKRARDKKEAEAKKAEEKKAAAKKAAQKKRQQQQAQRRRNNARKAARQRQLNR